MSEFFVGLRFTVSPSSVHQQRETLLRYVDPVAYEAIKAQMLAEAEHINKEHISAVFYPVDVKVNAQALTAQITGDVVTVVGISALPAQRLVYEILYRYHNGRLWVKSFEEVKAHA